MLKKEEINFIPYLLLGLSIVILLITHSPNIGFDTAGYVNFSPMRPPMYPIFIELFKWAGADQLKMVMWAQAILTCAVLLYTRKWLQKHLVISDISIFITYLVIVISMFFATDSAIITTIMAEGIAFPLFIMAFLTLVECFQQFSLKKLSMFALWTGLLILTRAQFYYFYLAFVMLIGWYVWKRVAINKIIIAIMLIFSSIVLTNLLDKTYHYFMHHSFSPTLSTLGEQLIVQPVYLTNIDSEKYFTDPLQRKYIKDVMEEISQNHLGNVILNPGLSTGLLPTYAKVNPRLYQAVVVMRDSYNHGVTTFWGPPIPSRDLLFDYYDNNYNPIMIVAKSHDYKMSPQSADNFKIKVSMILFKNELKKNLVFIIMKWIKFTGSLPLILFLLIILFTTITRFIQNRNSMTQLNETTLLFVFVGILLIFMNNGVVAITEAFVLRYFFYSYFILYCIAALVADRLFNRLSINT